MSQQAHDGKDRMPEEGDAPSPPNPSSKTSSARQAEMLLLTHRIVVIVLGLTVLATGLNMTILQALGRETPPALSNLGSVAIGALAMALSTIKRPQ